MFDSYVKYYQITFITLIMIEISHIFPKLVSNNKTKCIQYIKIHELLNTMVYNFI